MKTASGSVTLLTATTARNPYGVATYSQLNLKTPERFVSMGLHGALAFLTEQKWENVEVLYIAEQQVVFVTSHVGNAQPCHYTYLGVGPRQLRYKALNARARELHKQAKQAAAAFLSHECIIGGHVPAQMAAMFLKQQNTCHGDSQRLYTNWMTLSG